MNVRILPLAVVVECLSVCGCADNSRVTVPPTPDTVAITTNSPPPLESHPEPLDAAEIYIGLARYDGILLRCTLAQAKQHVAEIEGVQKVYNGTPFLYRVPSKPYHAYNVVRNDGATFSEVTVYSKSNKVIMLKDVFNGELFDDPHNAQKSYSKMASELKRIHGPPDFESSDRTTWVMDDVSKHLTIELPDNGYGMPIVKITLWVE